MNICSNNPGRFLLGFILLCAVVIAQALIVGCSTISAHGNRLYSADDIVGKSGFKREYVEAGNFTLLTYQKISKQGECVRIYIEGDGNAWKTKKQLSDDPTPRQPVALYLACEDPYDNIIYIARPGQFLENSRIKCNPTYWSTRRFSPEVVDVVNKIIDRIKVGAGADFIELVGYSGGAAIAVLVAAKRDDVAELITIAGNLDHEALSAYHKTSPLDGSLNPIDYALSVKNIPQRHFAGAKDKVVPLGIIKKFAKTSGDTKCKSVILVKDCGHNKGWVKAWGTIISENNWIKEAD